FNREALTSVLGYLAFPTFRLLGETDAYLRIRVPSLSKSVRGPADVLGPAPFRLENLRLAGAAAHLLELLPPEEHGPARDGLREELRPQRGGQGYRLQDRGHVLEALQALRRRGLRRLTFRGPATHKQASK